MSPELEALIAERAADAKTTGALIERAEIIHAYLLMPAEDFQTWLYARGDTMMHELMREVG